MLCATGLPRRQVSFVCPVIGIIIIKPHFHFVTLKFKRKKIECQVEKKIRQDKRER
ncbi:hypothetical protein JCM17204_10930 [Blautia stercoris]